MDFRQTPPGVYLEFTEDKSPSPLETGVPVFLGLIQSEDETVFLEPCFLSYNGQFDEKYPKQPVQSYLRESVRGFFLSGGRMCYVMPMREISYAALEAVLLQVELLETIDLICAPDLMTVYQEDNAASWEMIIRLQEQIVAHCNRKNDRFAILDGLPVTLDTNTLFEQRQRLMYAGGQNCALYYPWLVISPARQIPPCGYIAGIYTATDYLIGVHKAPANELLPEVFDLSYHISSRDQALLNEAGINCIRALRGYGIRIWGAKTLSNQSDWMYVNVRRLFFQIRRWLEQNASNVVFEPNVERLWLSIENVLNVYLNSLVQAGRLRNFYVKCNAETNPFENREQGIIRTEIGIAPTIPTEYIIIRVMHSDSGLSFI